MKKLLLSIAALLCAVTTNLFATEGALNGKFTVNADGKKVQFSQGNLQYQASTQIWRFAEHQWDVIGEANANIASDYTGWIDLFGWSTVNNPTLATSSQNDYPTTFTDWGTAAISNGGNEGGMWRTLSAAEWDYLLNQRQNAEELKGKATVNGVKCMILLPDGFVMPAGLSVTNRVYAWDEESFSTEEWSRMAANGAVVLPMGGYRTQTEEEPDQNKTIDNLDNGYYWTSTPDVEDEGRSHKLSIDATQEFTAYSSSNSQGYLVRLTIDAEGETAIENTMYENKNAWKIIRNGRVLILREGKVYNALGVEMK